jgi:hypothetical protein
MIPRSPSVVLAALALAGGVAACAPTPQSEAALLPAPPPTVPHLRYLPGVNQTVIGALPPGLPVQSTGSTYGGWTELQTPEGTGWVQEGYLGLR